MPTIDLEGRRLDYLDAGSGPAVVLLHAFPLGAEMWAGQVASLSPRYRVVAPSYPGLGRSEPPAGRSTMGSLADAVLGLLDRLGIARAAVGGLSMGGYLALELYRRRPGLFRGLALCDTRAGADTAEGARGREAFAENALAKGLGWVADEMIPKLLRPSADARVVHKVRALIEGGTPAGVAAAQRAMAVRPDSFPTLRTISCPTLVVVGADDTLTPPVESEKLASAIAGATLRVLPDAGHIANLENPAAFDAALGELLAGLPA